MDVIERIVSDHERFRRMLSDLEAAIPDERADLFAELRSDLARHEVAEEEVVYPAVRRSVPGGERLADARIGEEQVAEELLAELDVLDPASEVFSAKLRQLRLDVLAHAGREETEVLPALQAALGRERLQQMGTLFEAAKRTAPTHPHPAAPNRPPWNIAIGPVVALADRARDGLRRALG